MRVRSVTYTRQRKKKHYRRAKGSYATKKNRWRMVKQHLRKVHEFAYVSRKDRKPNFRRLWIIRINAASREYGKLTYGQFMNGLKKANVSMDRKVLADLAVNDPESFRELTNIARSSLAPAA
ncbi:50S ribosomal protein L20 [bacterium F11]|nr:50S ribosomal protein L20 [bacterium F11]